LAKKDSDGLRHGSPSLQMRGGAGRTTLRQWKSCAQPEY
jgi:hypothetical protein